MGGFFYAYLFEKKTFWLLALPKQMSFNNIQGFLQLLRTWEGWRGGGGGGDLKILEKNQCWI